MRRLLHFLRLLRYDLAVNCASYVAVAHLGIQIRHLFCVESDLYVAELCLDR